MQFKRLAAAVVQAEDFRQQFLGDFKIDERRRALVARLEEYYRNTPDSMSNREAFQHWNDFIWWCDQYGYSKAEINAAKMEVKTTGN
jgi:hypothetical protein